MRASSYACALVTWFDFSSASSFLSDFIVTKWHQTVYLHCAGMSCYVMLHAFRSFLTCSKLFYTVMYNATLCCAALPYVTNRHYALFASRLTAWPRYKTQISSLLFHSVSSQIFVWSRARRSMWGYAALLTAMTSTRPGTQWCSTSTLRRVLEERKFTCSGE